jgi:hypothetical protein
MRRYLSQMFVGLFAVPLMLASSTALAGPTGAAACNLLTGGTCEFVTTPLTCAGQCTAPSFVAECDGECDVSASASCTGTCNGTCMADCTANPGTFDCTTECTTNCQSNCTSACANGAPGCDQDCNDDCTNRCGVQCSATAPSVTCSDQCMVSCNASCQVQANIDCHVNCTANIAPGECNIDCKAPTGAVFCGTPPQYVDLATAADQCASYLESQGITTTTTCTIGSGCNTTVGCSAAPALGSSTDRWGVAGIAGLMMGLGLLVSRRRKS